MDLKFENIFTDSLPADIVLENHRRKVFNAVYSFVDPIKTNNPQLIHYSKELADELRISNSFLTSKEFTQIMTGNILATNSLPYAMCYGGHQFGHWAGQLGDGRAINLGQLSHQNKNWTLQLKGAGPTPYSRSADGLAVLRSSIREYLCSEAMHHLRIPTTRALSLSLTGDKVLRDVMYDGNPAYEKGAIVCRVAESFLRFGNYEIFTARKDINTLKTLVDFTINQYFSHLGKPNKETYIKFFEEVKNRTLELIIHWQRVGFVHGVLNTDNMSILGLTIDYGPYGWMDDFDFGWTPNTTDREHKRYRFGNQPNIGLWNLYQLANALYPLIKETDSLEQILDSYSLDFEQKSLEMMCEKLGISKVSVEDKVLISSLENNLLAAETDMTIFFRSLSNFNPKSPFEGLTIVKEAFYSTSLSEDIKNQWNEWFLNYANRLKKENIEPNKRQQNMNTVNPKYVLRNYMAQMAIEKAIQEDYSLIEELYTMLTNPYDDQPKYQKWFSKRPYWAKNKIGSSMLSCSS